MYLSPEEQQYLNEHMHTEIMRVLLKLFQGHKEESYGALLNADAQHLPIIQGKLIGIQGCINLISINAAKADLDIQRQKVAAFAVEVQKPAKPLASAQERKKKPKVAT